MKILNLEEPNEVYDRYGSPSELSDYDFKPLEDMGFDVVAYWYSAGCYEGSGELVGRRNGLWCHLDLGHCSCYGPVESLHRLSSGEKSLADLEKRMTVELQNDVLPLIELLVKEGHE